MPQKAAPAPEYARSSRRHFDASLDSMGLACACAVMLERRRMNRQLELSRALDWRGSMDGEERVLVVEDQEGWQRHLTSRLERLGWSIRSAYTLWEGRGLIA